MMSSTLLQRAKLHMRNLLLKDFYPIQSYPFGIRWKKNKLYSFTNLDPKDKSSNQKRVIKLREEREFFSRYLIIQQQRPELVPRLEDVIGHYEMSDNARSLFGTDGCLLTPNDKSDLLNFVKALVKKKQEEKASLPSPTPTETPLPSEIQNSVKVIVIDAMAIIQCIKKTADMLTIKDLVNEFIIQIKGILSPYDEGRVVFDQYLENSLKSNTRRKTSATTNHNYNYRNCTNSVLH